VSSGAYATRAGSASNSQPIRSRRRASGRLPLWTATSPILGSSRCFSAIRSTASC
jgi:hypothetical protein